MGRDAVTGINSTLVEAVRNECDPMTLLIVEAIAHEKSENQRLLDERDWLKSRIAEEDARLAHA